MLINLKSKQRSENLEVFEVPEDLSGHHINDKWGHFQDTEGKYDDAIQNAIRRMKDLEKDYGRFTSLSDKIIKWHAQKDKFLKEDIKQTDELPVIRAKINVMKSFNNEFKAIKASMGKANTVGQKVIEGEHSSAKEVKDTIEKKMNNLTHATDSSEVEKNQKLDKVLKYLEDMETKSVEFASKSDKLNSLFSTTSSHLSESISANTSKEVEELQKEIDDIEKSTYK